MGRRAWQAAGPADHPRARKRGRTATGARQLDECADSALPRATRVRDLAGCCTTREEGSMRRSLAIGRPRVHSLGAFVTLVLACVLSACAGSPAATAPATQPPVAPSAASATATPADT